MMCFCDAFASSAVLVATCASGAASNAWITEEPAQRIVDRFVDASGGHAAIEDVRSFHVSGEYTLTGVGLTGSIDLYFAQPDKLYFKVELPGFGMVERGYDGEVGWSNDPQLGVRIITDGELNSLQRQAIRMFSILPGANTYKNVTYSNIYKYNGEQCNKLMVTINGDTYSEFFDRDIGLLVGRREIQISAQGPAALAGAVSEYERIGKFRIGTRWTHSAGGNIWTAKYKRFAFDKVAPSVFALPDAIRNLIRN